MNRAKLLLSSSLFALGGLFGASVPAAPPQTAAQAVPIRGGWGVAVEADRPFHRVGDDLEASFTITNFSRQDAYAFTPVTSGNGCTYRFRVLLPTGEVLWQPGSIVNGMFSGPGCTFGTTLWDFSSRTQVQRSNTIPLIYQNADGNGVLGDPLPPGVYQLEVRVSAIGPQRTFGAMGPGGFLTASVPFVIEP